MRVYWSGAAILLKADSELRAVSGGRQSLDSALEGLRRCCFTEGRTWRAKELFAEFDRQTGYGIFTRLYQEHVPDSEFPDVEATYAKLGIATESGSISMILFVPSATSCLNLASGNVPSCHLRCQ